VNTNKQKCTKLMHLYSPESLSQAHIVGVYRVSELRLRGASRGISRGRNNAAQFCTANVQSLDMPPHKGLSPLMVFCGCFLPLLHPCPNHQQSHPTHLWLLCVLHHRNGRRQATKQLSFFGCKDCSVRQHLLTNQRLITTPLQRSCSRSCSRSCP
jgi:hypothetical protein